MNIFAKCEELDCVSGRVILSALILTVLHSRCDILRTLPSVAKYSILRQTRCFHGVITFSEFFFILKPFTPNNWAGMLEYPSIWLPWESNFNSVIVTFYAFCDFNHRNVAGPMGTQFGIMQGCIIVQIRNLSCVNAAPLVTQLCWEAYWPAG